MVKSKQKTVVYVVTLAFYKWNLCQECSCYVLAIYDTTTNKKKQGNLDCVVSMS